MDPLTPKSRKENPIKIRAYFNANENKVGVLFPDPENPEEMKIVNVDELNVSHLSTLAIVRGKGGDKVNRSSSVFDNFNKEYLIYLNDSNGKAEFKGTYQELKAEGKKNEWKLKLCHYAVGVLRGLSEELNFLEGQPVAVILHGKAREAFEIEKDRIEQTGNPMFFYNISPGVEATPNPEGPDYYIPVISGSFDDEHQEYFEKYIRTEGGKKVKDYCLSIRPAKSGNNAEKQEAKNEAATEVETSPVTEKTE